MALTESQKKQFLSIPELKQLKKEYESQMAGMGRMRMKGRGFWDDVSSWFKEAGVKADKWLKDTKALSKLGTVVGAISLIPGLQEFAPVAGAIKGVAGATGYGMRGGNSMLAINPPGQRLTGKGLTFAYNGVPTMIGNGCGCGYRKKMSGGAGTQFYSSSSEYGKVKF